MTFMQEYILCGSAVLMLLSPYTEHFLTIVTLNIMYAIKHNQAMIIAMANKQIA